MPVALLQIRELHAVCGRYMTGRMMERFLQDLQTTQAYRENRSFAITIDRILDYHHQIAQVNS